MNASCAMRSWTPLKAAVPPDRAHLRGQLPLHLLPVRLRVHQLAPAAAPHARPRAGRPALRLHRVQAEVLLQGRTENHSFVHVWENMSRLQASTNAAPKTQGNGESSRLLFECPKCPCVFWQSRRFSKAPAFPPPRDPASLFLPQLWHGIQLHG
ncbi:hypothetical protein CEXT_177171 [Caerostris extrusa]|uniref:Uncharacterized protein n=1 Tax=Caerostris extrusa TaxID=172846 RepID=A0AAV4WY86_CAEEX|nr:hypothetical protein CEXT_177171 [Caerostris extrusa]